MKALIHVRINKNVLDPQGKAIQRVCSSSFGHKEVAKVRQGKLFDVELDIDDKDKAKEILEDLCQKLFANSITEEYEIFSISDERKKFPRMHFYLEKFRACVLG